MNSWLVDACAAQAVESLLVLSWKHLHLEIQYNMGQYLIFESEDPPTPMLLTVLEEPFLSEKVLGMASVLSGTHSLTKNH